MVSKDIQVRSKKDHPNHKKLYFTIFELIKQGKNPNQISKDLSISKQKIHYYTHKLKEKGYIEKKGYGTWEVKKFNLSHLDFNKQKTIRGHAFTWTIKIPKILKNQLKNKLINSKLKYDLIGKEKFQRIYIKNRKIWICKNSIIIYENKSFYAQNSINARKYAVISLLEILKALEQELGINLKPYTFKTSREHYGMIKNDLAIQCNRKKEKIIVHDELEGDWLWIDDSESLGELENGGKKAVLRSKQVQDWWNDNKKHNFQVTPTFLLENINKVTENQIIFAENMKSHIKAIQSLSEGVNKLTNVVTKIKEENNRLKQRTLDQF